MPHIEPWSWGGKLLFLSLCSSGHFHVWHQLWVGQLCVHPPTHLQVVSNCVAVYLGASSGDGSPPDHYFHHGQFGSVLHPRFPKVACHLLCRASYPKTHSYLFCLSRRFCQQFLCIPVENFPVTGDSPVHPLSTTRTRRLCQPLCKYPYYRISAK